MFLRRLLPFTSLILADGQVQFGRERPPVLGRWSAQNLSAAPRVAPAQTAQTAVVESELLIDIRVEAIVDANVDIDSEADESGDGAFVDLFLATVYDDGDTATRRFDSVFCSVGPR